MDWLALLTLLGVAVVAVLCVLIWRGVSRPAGSDISPMLATLRDELARGNERIERELRGEIAETARIGRSDVTQQLGQFQQVLATQLTSVATLQNNQIDTFAQQEGMPKRFRGMMTEEKGGKASQEPPKPAEVVPQYVHGTGNSATPTAAQRKAEARGGRAFIGCIREHSRCICVRGGESCFRARGESCRSPLPTTVRRFPGVYGKAPQAGFL